MGTLNAMIQGLLLGGLYALFAAGLSLIFGVMRMVNIAHGDLIVASAYFAYFVMQMLGIGPFTSLLIVVPVVAAFGYALQRWLLNYTLGAGDLPPLLVTIALSIILQNVLLIVFTADVHRLQAGPIEIASWAFNSELSVGVLPVLQFVTSVIIIGALQLLFYKSSFGRAFRATSDDQQVAQLMGIETRHIFSLAMALSLAVVAVAGVFLAIRTNFNPFTGPLLLIFGFEAIVMGGLGSLWGTLVGGILLGIAQAIGGQIQVGLPFVAGHVAFLAVLYFLPQGLFPKVSQ
ncbi:MAG: branched-chain amino acid ABC transporter permease [Ancalomicrobiaceae bacterium]|nr:branched-chain amino acid ABC transporter permease [Ancalomicrobiaceae bacterium]